MGLIHAFFYFRFPLQGGFILFLYSSTASFSFSVLIHELSVDNNTACSASFA